MNFEGLILPSHRDLNLPNGLFLQVFWQFVYISYLSFVLFPFHTPWFDHPNNIGENKKLWSCILCNFLCPFGSSLLGLDIFLCIQLSKILSPCSSIRLGDQVSHILEILIFRFQDNRSELGHWRCNYECTFERFTYSLAS